MLQVSDLKEVMPSLIKLPKVQRAKQILTKVMLEMGSDVNLFCVKDYMLYQF